MHQCLHPLSCHLSHVTNNLPTVMISQIWKNCSDNVDNGRIFKSTMIQHKAYLFKKSGHSEELVDKQFISCALRVKRKKLLEKKREKSDGIVKYQMVTDIFFNWHSRHQERFQKVSTYSMIKDDEELNKVFSEGVKHFWLSEKMWGQASKRS